METKLNPKKENMADIEVPKRPVVFTAFDTELNQKKNFKSTGSANHCKQPSLESQRAFSE